MNRLVRWLIDGPEPQPGTYRQQLAAWDAQHPIAPLKLPPIKVPKGMRESDHVWAKLRRVK